MNKLVKLGLMVIFPACALVMLSACASTPKCDNDACYNRQISSVKQAGDVEENDQDKSDKPEYFRAEGYHRE